jgi:hypothetical protein
LSGRAAARGTGGLPALATEGAPLNFLPTALRILPINSSPISDNVAGRA